MKGLTTNVIVATVVFFVVTIVFSGDGFATDALVFYAFSAVVFAMIYAAFQVGVALFRNSD